MRGLTPRTSKLLDCNQIQGLGAGQNYETSDLSAANEDNQQDGFWTENIGNEFREITWHNIVKRIHPLEGK